MLTTDTAASSDVLRLVMDSLHEGFGLLAPDFTILELNKQAMRIDQRAREDLIGQSYWIAYPGTEQQEVGKLYKKAMAERMPIALTHPYVWNSGETSWFETRAFPVENGCLAVLFRDVTERHIVSSRLEAGERRFKAAIAAIEGVLWTNSADGQMVGQQASWAALTGQSFEEYQGYGWADAIHADDRQATIDAWDNSVASQSTFEIEHRVRRHDGAWRLCAVRAVPVVDSSGDILEWVGIHRDITDTRANALRLEQLAETINAVFYVLEIEPQQIAYVSQACEQIWGRSTGELYADWRSFLNDVHPDDRARLEAALHEEPAGKSAEIEYRIQRADGSERIIRDRPIHTIDPVTGSRRIVGLATDETEYRHARDQLERNAETFANLVVSNPYGIYVIDADFRLMNVSRGAETLFANIDPLIGRNFEDVLRIIWPDPFASQLVGIFRKTLETGESYQTDSTIERRANIDEIEAYDWRIERIILPDGQHGLVCFFYNLTERNAHEAQLTQALADQDLLAREIDHRVKNSLMVVAALLSMQRHASASEETRAALDEAAARVNAVASIHERLHKSDQLGIIAFGDYLEGLCADLADSMRSSGFEMDFQTVDVDVPAEVAMSLALIANELVTNAFKHGRAAGATKVSVMLQEDNGWLILTVSDNGNGLPAETVSKPASLGLKMVKAMARQLKATTRFPSPGKPARFNLSVPIN